MAYCLSRGLLLLQIAAAVPSSIAPLTTEARHTHWGGGGEILSAVEFVMLLGALRFTPVGSVVAICSGLHGSRAPVHFSESGWQCR